MPNSWGNPKSVLFYHILFRYVLMYWLSQRRLWNFWLLKGCSALKVRYLTFVSFQTIDTKSMVSIQSIFLQFWSVLSRTKVILYVSILSLNLWIPYHSSLGVIQKPRGHNFALYWPPTYPCGHFLCTDRGQKWQILDYLPPCFCPRGF